MKVAIFTDTFYPEVNGVVTCITNICKNLSKRGYEFLVFAPKYPKKVGSNNVDLGKNVRVIRIHSSGLSTNKGFSRFAFPNLFKHFAECKDFDPDIIHIHTPATIGFMGMLYAKIHRKPSIGTYHTYLPDFLGYISPLKLMRITWLISLFYPQLKPEYKALSANLRSIQRESKLKKNIKKPFVKLTWLYTRLVYDRCNLITTPSKIMVKELIANNLKRPVVYLTNGVEVSLFSSYLEKYGPRKRKAGVVSLINVGRLGYEKHVDDVIRSVAYLNRKVKNMKFELTVVGDGAELKKLELLAKSLGIADRVVFTGLVSRNNLPKYYGNADIFVTASTIETQGIVVLEAMASSLPVVGVGKLALKELIVDGYNGYQVKAGDFKDMARKIYAIAKNEELMNEMSKNALNYVSEHRLENALNKLDSIYKKVYESYGHWKVYKRIKKETKKLSKKFS